jgi:hypothetical protein
MQLPDFQDNSEAPDGPRNHLRPPLPTSQVVLTVLSKRWLPKVVRVKPEATEMVDQHGALAVQLALCFETSTKSAF